jgi:alkylhydroperoxidase family enzyme
MQRKPKMVKEFAQMHAAIWDPEGEVEHGFKRLIVHMVSRAADCQSCMAHNIGFALYKGVDEAKVAAIWEYNFSPLDSAVERFALDFALAAGAMPNDVKDEMFAQMRQHGSKTRSSKSSASFPFSVS